MNNFFKKHKLAVLATAFSLSVGSVFGFYLVSNNQLSSKADSDAYSYEELLPAIEQVSKECAISLAQKQEPNLDLEVKDIVPIYNVTENIVGYSVSYYDGETPYGYASFDFTTEELITDFVINKNTESMYTTLSEAFADSDSSVDADDCTDKLYSTSNIDYAVSATTEDDEVFFYNGTTYEDDDFEAILDHYEDNYLDYYDNTEYEDNFYSEINNKDIDNDFIVQGKISDWFKQWLKKLFPSFFSSAITPTAYPTHSEVFKEVDKLLGDISEPVMLPQYSKEKSLMSQQEIMTTTNRYACGLVALTGVCNQENILLNNNIQDTFNKLWDLTNTQSHIYETREMYGKTVELSGTSVFELGRGMILYGSELGVKISPYTKDQPEFDIFKQAVDGHYSSVLCYQIADKGGHGVSILGYSYGTIDDTTYDYVLAADGWYNDVPRYVLYKPSLFESTTALIYDIQK